MMEYILKRLFIMIPTLFGITLITFLVIKLAPGDPVSLKLMLAGDGISPQALAQELARKESPLELPSWYVDIASKIGGKPAEGEKGSRAYRSVIWLGENTLLYGKWISNLVRLDFGLSVKDKQPVMQKIKEALPITLLLNIVTIFIVYIISVPLGVWSALKRESILDKIVMIKLFILYSLPTFWVGMLLLTYFAGGEYLNLFPLMGLTSPHYDQMNMVQKIGDIIWHLTLPVIVSVYGSFAFLSRFSRSNFLEVVKQDYVRTARAKGLSENVVMMKHAFRNSLIPLITLMGGLLPALLGGSVIIEQIFSIPGMGMLSFEAVLGRDYNLIMGLATISSLLTLIGLLISDILYVVIDPRINFDSK